MILRRPAVGRLPRATEITRDRPGGERAAARLPPYFCRMLVISRNWVRARSR
jgi:hypothetical protein